MATTSPNAEGPPPEGEERATEAENAERADAHEQDIEEREAYEYWGYLFKQDKTGTDKLKSLLRGLKDVINERYEPYDQSDLTPSQLAAFYREMHGDYDQLFLDTPSESISFIYKSLGCLHSLQPPAYNHEQAFRDPTVPALKTEGWIMWQTIQLLLGPEEHAEFIREAVTKWDVKDHDSGDPFPKILPRECFPREPDKHMVAWYEGVSERLRKEAEEEERRHNQIEVEHDPPPRRLHSSQMAAARREGDPPTDDEGSVDSRGRALAYFRNPLYRHVDGRPGIVRRNSKRPAVSPRQTFMGRGKDAASSFGRIARNVGSPHLWDGGRGASRSRDRDGRRKSHPDYYADEGPLVAPGPRDDRYPARDPSGHSHRRRRSSQPEPRPERPSSGVAPDEQWDAGDDSPVYSPQPRHSTPSDVSRPRHARPESRDQRDQQPLRHSKSHEPTPTQREGEDYFEGYDDPSQRRNSSTDKPFTPPSGGGFGPSFGPSASPLFASHIAKQPPPPRSQPGPSPQPAPYEGGAPLRNPSIRRAQGRYPSRSPEPGSRPPPPADPRDPRDWRDPRDYRYDSPAGGRPPSGPRYNPSPAPYDVGPPSGPPPPPHPGPPMGSQYDSGLPPSRDPRDRDPRDQFPRDRDPRDGRSGGGRLSVGADTDPYYSEDGRRSRPKQTRFADNMGVGGRRYPDESPWDERRRS